MKKIISTIMVAALLYNGAAFAENIVTKYDYDSSYKVTAIKDIKKPGGADFVYIVKYDASGRMTGFTQWNGTAVSVTDAASTKVIAVKGNKITPVGKNDVITSDTKVNTYTVTVNADSNGTYTVNKTKAAEGESIELTATPNAGFEVDAVKLGDTVLTAAGGKYTFTMPANNVTVTVSFKAVVTQETAVEKATKALKAAGLKDSDINVVKWSDFKAIGEPEEKTYAVNVTNLTPGCGRLDIEPAVYGAVKAGTEIKLTPIANDGYELDKITVDNNKLEAVDGKYSFTMPAKDVEVTVSFKAKVVEKTAVEKAVEALKAGENGVKEENIKTVLWSDFKELGAPAAETYKVTVNEVEHCTVTVTPEDHSALINGTSVTVKVTPENGYEAKIMVNGVEQTVDSNGEFTFAIMGADVNIVITVVKTVSAQENAIAALKSANVDETNIVTAAWSNFNEIN
mgnify:FL=1